MCDHLIQIFKRRRDPMYTCTSFLYIYIHIFLYEMKTHLLCVRRKSFSSTQRTFFTLFCVLGSNIFSIFFLHLFTLRFDFSGCCFSLSFPIRTYLKSVRKRAKYKCSSATLATNNIQQVSGQYLLCKCVCCRMQSSYSRY